MKYVSEVKLRARITWSALRGLLGAEQRAT